MQDLVIVGGGVAGASVLVRLADAATLPGARVTLVDPAGETGGGAAYHRGVHPALLLNDPVSRIDRTGLGFGRWIAARRDALGDELDRSADPRVAAWNRAHGPALRAGDVAPLFVPRRWFGDFIRERFAQATDALARLGTTVTVHPATVVDIRPDGAGWSVETDRAGTVVARTVVLATGGPRRPPAVTPGGYLCGTPGLDLDAVERALRERPGTDLLVLGSAASAVEMVHCVEGDEALRETIGQVVVVSPSGRLPDGLPSPAPAAFEPGPALAAAGDADALMAALAGEVATARRMALTIPDIYPAVHAGFLTAFEALPEAEKKRIVDVHSRRYLTLLRKTSPVYARSARRLERRGRLLAVAGRVTTVEPAGDGFTALLDDGRRYQAGVVLDCRGFGDPTADHLLGRMVAGGHIAVNDSGLGVSVDPGFEAAPGLTVLGPLLAGTAQGGEYVWHLEDIPRIYAYADRIVESVLRRLVPTDTPAGGIAVVG